jgi:hypothetical protein
MHKMACIGVLVLLFLAAIVQAIPEKDQELVDAVERGDAGKANALINARGNVNARDVYGNTVLYWR